MTTKAQILQGGIRAYCLECCCGSRSEVARCSRTDCPLHEYRFGTDPNPSTSRGFAKFNGYKNGSEQRQPDLPPPKKKPHREFKSRQGISPKPITPNDKDRE